MSGAGERQAGGDQIECSNYDGCKPAAHGEFDESVKAVEHPSGVLASQREGADGASQPTHRACRLEATSDHIAHGHNETVGRDVKYVIEVAANLERFHPRVVTSTERYA